MPSSRLALTAAAAAAALIFPATAAAAPPPNDNYLASTSIVAQDGSMPLQYSDSVDTTEATTQADTFNPNRDGQPFGGGDPEPTSCGAGQPSFGRTAWWDFRPHAAGGVELRASGGFEVVVAVYEWSAQTSRITRVVRCQNDDVGSETVLLPDVRRGRNYTVQVGGLNNSGGPLQLRLEYFPDRDGDGVLDALDECDRQRGIEAAGGCPPELRSTPRIRYDGTGGGIRITSLAVDDVPRGARAEVRCRRCGGKVTARARRSGVLQLRRFVGREVRNGDRIEVRITHPGSGRGRYRFGAIGKFYRWPVRGDGLGDRLSRCMNPGSRRPIKCR
jgi:hypothetical protein